MAYKQQYIDIEIDKLTNSLENVITGDNFPTDIVITEQNDFKTITKKAGWLFDWKTLGAVHVGGNLMIINTTAALKLINKYFNK